MTVAPTGNADITVSVAAGAADDLAGNASLAAADTLTVTYQAVDSTAPTVASIERQTPSGENTNADTLTFRVTFSEDVENVGTADFAVVEARRRHGHHGRRFRRGRRATTPTPPTPPSPPACSG